MSRSGGPGSRPYRPAGSLRDGPWALSLTPAEAGWSYAGLRIADLPPGGSVDLATGDDEVLVLPLRGSARVTCGGEVAVLAGREGPFAGPTDFAYVPRGSRATITSAAGGQFAVPAARAGRTLPFRHAPAAGVPVELRGAGQSSREVHNLCTPGVFEADRLIVVEVITPGGNWSSYPPHKHDEAGPGESVLEEIYYYLVADGPVGPGMAYQRVYGTAGRPIDVLEEVHSGDVVLIPHGWHGPSMAVPGYDLYYLNVMAGPGPDRAWRICDDPAHSWVRETWVSQATDPRLPLVATDRRTS